MFSWVTDVVTGITSMVSVALEPPFSYFIGLTLVGAVIGIVKSIRRG